ncbi:MAG TPA: malto-oligosyltrehalose synthase [Burkholderiales bacterium]|nr:malto-oligosyltrehalose synthase [Burkholderiales bacterium]
MSPEEEIASGYLDVWGRQREIALETRAALAKALGAPARGRPARIASGRCRQPEILEEGGRVWGFMVQLYALRSERNWGIGDFTDLLRLVETSARLGAALVGVNPLHAALSSPYSPSSRHALNAVYIDVEAIPELAACEAAQRLLASTSFGKRLKALREADLVDYEGVRKAKAQVLELLFASLGAERRKAFAAFRKTLPKGARDYALYEALAEEHGYGWQAWPERHRDPRSQAVAAFARRHARRVEFHEYVQWNARLQLDAVQARAKALGMPIGLYFDLALGADRGGAEVWSDQSVFAAEVSCGAPPDEFNPRGQDWGLPPYSPRRLRAAGYRPFVDLLRANMPRGGALRLDHVMALMRLWWIPAGAKPERGGYVHYPFREMLGLLAQESRRNRCLVVGEDLGTVLPEFRQALNDAGVLSYRPLLFEKDAQGDFRPPEAYPREALVCVSTHDLPTWAGFFRSHDLELRKNAALSLDPDAERKSRENDKGALLAALARAGLDGSSLSAHRFIARAPAKLMLVQPEDVLDLAEQANLPGSVEQHPNWRRKLPLALEQWAADPRVRALARAVSPERGIGFRTPRATYRLQLHKGFRFRDATALVPYLAALGVSHVYASPFLKARPGSTHGYDIVDHNALNPEIGTEADLENLLAALRRHRMGLVMDIVPNHMGVLQGDNAWWQDVLEKGRASPYAKFFDIDWAPAKAELRGKVLLPVLGKHYGDALESGEVKLGRGEVRYYDHRFPLSLKTKGKRGRLDALALHRLLEKQHYRLAFWRVAADEINYRRFFEIVDLAGLRVEDRQVFDATHALIARLALKPGVEGLRVDHPDGLADPRQYLERLAELGRGPWVVVEKILADYEHLADWPMDGTTGYRFANLLTGLFVDASARERFDRIYQRFTGERRSFEEIARESRMLIMGTTLAADLNVLTTRLARIASGSRFTRDYTASGLRRAIAEVAARFPVYRTYVSPRGVSDADRRYIEWAVRSAQRASRVADPSVFDFLLGVLTLEGAPKHGARRAEMLRFAMRFQQFTAPVVAKGVEDTAFYRYHRLACLNEVGGDPRDFGLSLKAFHAATEQRLRQWPRTMLASSTHDTKRSEDVRARLAVLSEVPSAWRFMLRRWSVLNRSARSEAGPSRADEYLYYQVLLGIWPDAPPDAAALRGLRERLQAYMLKAVREAKVSTSWINPDTEYEQALERFVAASLENPLFLKDVNEAAPRLAHLGRLVGLSQALLKVASPGVPDLYQGCEVWDYSLVDPDNRRPVDYARRRALLSSLEDSSPAQLLGALHDGRAKLLVLARGLALRARMPELFHDAAYTALCADAGREENVCAFALRSGAQTVIAIAPRLFAALIQEGGAPTGEAVWGGSTLSLPGEFPKRFRNVLTNENVAVSPHGLRLADALATFPVALLFS